MYLIQSPSFHKTATAILTAALLMSACGGNPHVPKDTIKTNNSNISGGGITGPANKQQPQPTYSGPTVAPANVGPSGPIQSPPKPSIDSGASSGGGILIIGGGGNSPTPPNPTPISNNTYLSVEVPAAKNQLQSKFPGRDIQVGDEKTLKDIGRDGDTLRVYRRVYYAMSYTSFRKENGVWVGTIDVMHSTEVHFAYDPALEAQVALNPKALQTEFAKRAGNGKTPIRVSLAQITQSINDKTLLPDGRSRVLEGDSVFYLSALTPSAVISEYKAEISDKGVIALNHKLDDGAGDGDGGFKMLTRALALGAPTLNDFNDDSTIIVVGDTWFSTAKDANGNRIMVSTNECSDGKVRAVRFSERTHLGARMNENDPLLATTQIKAKEMSSQIKSANNFPQNSSATSVPAGSAVYYEYQAYMPDPASIRATGTEGMARFKVDFDFDIAQPRPSANRVMCLLGKTGERTNALCSGKAVNSSLKISSTEFADQLRDDLNVDKQFGVNMIDLFGEASIRKAGITGKSISQTPEQGEFALNALESLSAVKPDLQGQTEKLFGAKVTFQTPAAVASNFYLSRTSMTVSGLYDRCYTYRQMMKIAPASTITVGVNPYEKTNPIRIARGTGSYPSGASK